jgi:hypothetical protein
MDIAKREKTYDRLSEISMKMEIKVLPDSQYINEKLGQCHIFIEEVEKFFIEVSKEMSIVQRALNNAIACYETARDDLMATDPEIMSLPSLKDREARANFQLKKHLIEIKNYKNDLVDLENLQKAINVKLKNLGRVNMDIKIQLRLMDSQVRLGTPSINSQAARSLAEELSKSTVGLDIFKEASTSAEQIVVADPTEPLNVESLLDNDSVVQDLSSVNIPPIQTEPEERSLTDQLLDPLPTDPVDDLGSCLHTESPVETNPASTNESCTVAIDLDKILAPEPSISKVGGESSQTKSVEQTKILPESTQKEALNPTLKKSDEIDIDALLSQFK